ncbi:hypothetical protein V3N99_06625 [Dermatophilaceae bacterium Soc4.6]
MVILRGSGPATPASARSSRHPGWSCALVPDISGAYAWSEADRRRELPALVENDGCLISCAMNELMVEVPDPGAAHATDPLCRQRTGDALDRHGAAGAGRVVAEDLAHLHGDGRGMEVDRHRSRVRARAATPFRLAETTSPPVLTGLLTSSLRLHSRVFHPNLDTRRS